MKLTLDHIVIWVEDPLKSLEFFEKVVGLEGVRVAEFRAKKAPFPSVRVSEHSIIDLMPKANAPAVNKVAAKADPTVANSAGHPVNHLCLAMSREDYEALKSRLEDNGTPPNAFLDQAFGARGIAPHTFYFRDPDGNVFEARYYD